MSPTTRPKMRDRLSQIYWSVPVSMLGGLLLGLIFAIGHHLFYASLDGQPPSITVYQIAGSRFPVQELNTAIGTTFALLVRSCLVFAVSLSSTQLVWYAVIFSTRQLTVADVDQALSAISNLFVVLNGLAWLRWPLVLLAATVLWVIPIATIITPATLSVGWTSPPARWLDVPTVAYTSANLAVMYTMGTTASVDEEQILEVTFGYYGPNQAVNLIAIAVATQGQILPVQPPAPNSSWHTTFAGPSLSCVNVSSPLRDSILSNIGDYVNQTLASHGRTVGGPLFPSYLAWTPLLLPNSTLDGTMATQEALPFRRTTGGLQFYSPPLSSARSGFSAPLLIASIPAMLGVQADGPLVNDYSPNITMQTIVDAFVEPGFNVVQCDVLNATYDVNFTVVEGVQATEVMVQPIQAEPLRLITVAYSGVYLADCVGSLTETVNGLCSFDQTILSTFSYQAVFDAFANRVRGAIWLQLGPINLTSSTSVQDTVLARSAELRAVTDMDASTMNGSTQSIFLDYGIGGRPGLYLTPPEAPPPLPLVDMLEELFQNFTLSLMSSPSLQPNKSSPLFPPQSRVTFSTVQNVYAYSALKLWLAYGLALAVSAVIVALGLSAMARSGASYNNSFSGLLRLSRGARLSEDILEKDFTGHEPRPRYLRDAKISFAGDGRLAKNMNEGGSYAALSTSCPNGTASKHATSVSVDDGCESPVEDLEGGLLQSQQDHDQASGGLERPSTNRELGAVRQAR